MIWLVVPGGLSAEQLMKADVDDVIGWSASGIQSIKPEILEVSFSSVPGACFIKQCRFSFYTRV